MNYDTICQYVGQLYLQSRNELDSHTSAISDLQSKLSIANKERDDALKLALGMEKERANVPA